MKKIGILHSQLSGLIAALGHKDTFLIGDAGMPIPAGVERVDLALAPGIPSFRQALAAVLMEAQIEGYLLAEEIKAANPALHDFIQGQLSGIAPEYLPHEELKKRSASCRFAIRTGEFTPYPNVILRAGVIF